MVSRARVVVRKAVGDGSKSESREAGEAGVDVGEAEEAVVVVVGVEEGDLKSGEGEELC